MPESESAVPKTPSSSAASSSSGSLSRSGKSFLDLPYDVQLPIYRELLKSETGILYRICPVQPAGFSIRHEDKDERAYLDLKFALPLFEYNRKHGHGT
jgi:hypothetical protein